MKRRSRVLIVSLVALGLVQAVLGYAVWREDWTTRSLVVDRGPSEVVLLSKTHEIRRLYPSMLGPYSKQTFTVRGEEPDELVWVTGLESRVVEKNGSDPLSLEYMCHTNLSFLSVDAHDKKIGQPTHQGARLFTLVPGRMTISLPSGFGIPVRSSERLSYMTMTLNLNTTTPMDARFRSKLKIVRARDLKQPLKPLFRRSVTAYVPILEERQDATPEVALALDPQLRCGPVEREDADPELSCASPELLSNAVGTNRNTRVNDTTLHWWIQPGDYRGVTDVTEQLRLPYDTTVHYATAHLHPWGESATLVDRTTGTELFSFESREYSGKKGVEHMDELTFPEGVMLHADHTYELVTRYRNTSGERVDAMSIVYLYLHARELELE